MNQSKNRAKWKAGLCVERFNWSCSQLENRPHCASRWAEWLKHVLVNSCCNPHNTFIQLTFSVWVSVSPSSPLTSSCCSVQAWRSTCSSCVTQQCTCPVSDPLRSSSPTPLHNGASTITHAIGVQGELTHGMAIWKMSSVCLLWLFLKNFGGVFFILSGLN